MGYGPHYEREMLKNQIERNKEIAARLAALDKLPSILNNKELRDGFTDSEIRNFSIEELNLHIDAYNKTLQILYDSHGGNLSLKMKQIAMKQ